MFFWVRLRLIDFSDYLYSILFLIKSFLIIAMQGRCFYEGKLGANYQLLLVTCTLILYMVVAKSIDKKSFWYTDGVEITERA
jgi:hypothetical protein